MENVRPEVDAGRFPAKGSLGEPVVVEADIFGDGHDQLTAVLLWRPVGHREEASWREVPMAHLVGAVLRPDILWVTPPALPVPSF